MEILSSRTTFAGSTVRSGPDHLVRFYEADSSFHEIVAEYLRPALRAGDPAIVVATEEHAQAIHELLMRDGSGSAVGSGRVLFIDAHATLRDIMVDDRPDPAAFRRVIGELL